MMTTDNPALDRCLEQEPDDDPYGLLWEFGTQFPYNEAGDTFWHSSGVTSYMEKKPGDLKLDCVGRNWWLPRGEAEYIHSRGYWQKMDRTTGECIFDDSKEDHIVNQHEERKDCEYMKIGERNK